LLLEVQESLEIQSKIEHKTAPFFSQVRGEQKEEILVCENLLFANKNGFFLEREKKEHIINHHEGTDEQ